jgi:glucan phosphoethanolaminetransferase (alkaline phosphatase superfamily)
VAQTQGNATAAPSGHKHAANCARAAHGKRMEFAGCIFQACADRVSGHRGDDMQKIGFDFGGRACGRMAPRIWAAVQRVFSLRLGDGAAIFWLSVYFTAAMNTSFWAYAIENIHITGTHARIAVMLLPAVMLILHYIVFSLLLFPYTFKPVAITLLLISSGANFFMFRYKIYIDADMVRNVMDTNPGEALDLLTPGFALWVLLGGIVPAIAVWRSSISYQPFLRMLAMRAVRMAGALLLLALILFANFKPYAFFARNNNEARKLANPENYLYAVPRYFQAKSRANIQLERIDPDARYEPGGGGA